MRRARLVVHEHESLQVGGAVACAGGGTAVFEPTWFDLLARFVDRTGSTAFRLGYQRLTVGHHVGYLRVGPLAIEILPKLARQADLPWRDLLVHMLNEVADVRLALGSASPLQSRPRDLYELLVARFADLTERIVREGLLRSYREEEENGVVLRGRILMPQHVRANAARPDRVFTAYEVWDDDNTPNRMLHAALDVLTRTTSRWDLVRRAEDLRAAFPDFEPRALRRDAMRVSPDRRTARYREALALARMILTAERPDLRWGETEVISLLFDMNHLFEAYVATQLRRVPGLRVQTQSRLRFWQGDDGARRILKPDVIARVASSDEVIVIDTKWKELRDGRPSDEDLRQLYSYAEYVDAGRSFLLYPAGDRAERGALGRFVRGDRLAGTAFIALMPQPGCTPNALAVREQLQALLEVASTTEGEGSAEPRQTARTVGS